MGGAVKSAGLMKTGLGRSAALAVKKGVAVPDLTGKLLRPLVALALTDPRARRTLDDRFWFGCLAIQMAHEASLQHDDVLDEGLGRRDRTTLVAREGPGAALLTGDLYLTGSYRVAHMAASEGFMNDFLVAVEATAQGERLQCDLATSDDAAALYPEMIRRKSGALFGAAAALPGWLGVAASGSALSPAQLRELGTQIGSFYQMVDDFLDYCPSEDTGKPKLQDFANRIWTWVLGDRGPRWFDQSATAAIAGFFRVEGTGAARHSLAESAMEQLEEKGGALVRRLHRAGADPMLAGTVEGWMERCRMGLRAGSGDAGRPLAMATPGATVQTLAAAGIAAQACALGSPASWGRFFARNSRTFSFATLLFPEVERRLVRGIYAFCRFTDDLVDGADPETASTADLHRTLDAWTEIAQSAHSGIATGIPLADVVMGEMAARQIPFALAADLIAGVRMDIEPGSYATIDDLRIYTHRVASVVGMWMTHAFGIGDAWVLERAAEMGHAMQLTNIIRDVGEDLEQGRIYLPRDRMEFHGVTRDSLTAMRTRLTGDGAQPGAPNGRMHAPGAPPLNGRVPERGSAIDPGYIALLEELMTAADASYAIARQGIPFLPASFRRPVAVAAEVYRGIHDRVRANGYNNLNMRAHTRLGTKIHLARRALMRSAEPASAASLAHSGAQ